MISNAQAFSAPNSLFISEGNDQLFLLDTISVTEGRYVIKFNMYIPSSGNGAYFNIQHILKQTWAFECRFYNNGTGYVSAAGDKNFNYPENAWFPVEIDIDLDHVWASLTINNSVVKSWPFHYNCNSAAGDKVLSAVNFFSSSAVNSTSLGHLPGTYYVDDFIVLTDVSGEFSATPNSIAATLAPNTTDLLTVSVANSGSAATEYRIVTTYDIPNPDTTSTASFSLNYLNGETLSFFGSSSSHFEEAVVFPSSMLQEHIGKTLRSVSFPTIGNVDSTSKVQDVKVKIYDISNPIFARTSLSEIGVGPGELIYEQSFHLDDNSIGDWNTVYLNTPFVIDGRDLWIGVFYETPDMENYRILLAMPDNEVTGNYCKNWIWNSATDNWVSRHHRFPIVATIDGTSITSWLSVSPDSAVVTSGGNATVNATFNSEGMVIGEIHTAKLHCFTNEENNPKQVIPVTMEIFEYSVDDHNQIVVTVYPNPSIDHINITSDEIQRVEIHNIMGQRLFDGAYNDTHVVIPTNGMAPGTYMVTVTSTQGKTTKKVILR